MNYRSMCRAASLPALLLASSVVCAGPTYEFDIRGATLASALKQFASQTGLQIAYFTEVAEGRLAPNVSGTLTADEALRSLLDASGLSFEHIDGGVIAIHAIDGDADSAAPVTAKREPIAMESQPRSYGLRLANAVSPSGSEAATAESKSTTPASQRGVVSLEEVVVTGSNIRGVQNDTAPVISFDRGYIERSGYSNMMQLVNSLPMNFKGGSTGANESALYGQSANAGQNLTRGTGFNLHGLGAVSTLTLINGRRVAPSAQGQFVDMSTIPLSAVERIEILTDGASAIYGADAVAGVVNIILRKDFSGSETALQYGSDSDGTLDEQRLSQTFGAQWDSGNVLMVGELYRRDPLDIRDRDFIVDAGGVGPTYLLPRRKLGTLLVALDQQLGERLDLSSNLLYSYEEVDSKDTSSEAPSLGTQSPITNQWSATFGLGYDTFGDWRLSLDSTVAQVSTQTGLSYINTETNEPQLLIKDYNDRFQTWSLDAKMDGSLFALPGGMVRLAFGASYREDDLRSTRVRVVPARGFEIRALDSRNVTSAFGELYVPLIGAQQGITGVQRLDLSLAARYDEYSDFGSTSNPKIGVVWTPITGLDLRAAYSTSFRAPNVAEKALGARGNQLYTELLDSPDGTELVPVMSLVGSAALVAEESDNLALGFTWKPEALTGAQLSVNYFEIDYTNRISQPPFVNGMLSQRDVYGELIVDLADDAAAQAYLDQRLALGDNYFDYLETGVTGVRYALDLRQQNAARTQLSGFDVAMSHAWRRDVDTFSAQFNVTYLRELLTSLTETTTTFDQVGRYNQPLDWRVRALGSWLRGGLSTTLVVSYADSYINNTQLIEVPIASWTTVDLNVSYDFDANSTWLSGTRLGLSVSNLLDRDPPPAAGPIFMEPIGFDVFNADALGRFITLRLAKRW